MNFPRSSSLLIVLALASSGCSDDVRIAVGTDGTTTSTTTMSPTTMSSTTTTVAAGRGWLEGDDLEWSGSALVESDGAVALSEIPAARDDSVEPTGGDAGALTTTYSGLLPVPPPIDSGPLKAGSIDDGEDVAGYLEYRRTILEAGVAVRELDVSESTLITVLGDNGLPVLDARIEFWDPTADADTPMVELRTTADGSVRFLPAAMTDHRFDHFDLDIIVGEVRGSVSFDRGVDEITVTLPTPGGIDGTVALDVHFVLDATGSMGDEIARLRDNMTSIAEQIAALPSEPDVRFGMTVYRDEGDAFVTRTFDLTGDLGAFLEALADVTADGGGDYPEAMDEALADALEKPEWRHDGAVELIVLLADAPPQIARAVQTPYTQSALAAAARGVKIFPVAASGTDDQAEFVMRELAFVTGGRFVFLSYGVAGAATGDHTDITADDYDELPLDQLVVRLVEDELAALRGGLGQVTTTTTGAVTTTTYEQ